MITYPLLSVAIGGALGASARFGLGLWLRSDGFPVAILAANILGSFMMGLVVVWLGRAGLPQWQPFLMTGLLGGFTTFSAFSLEAYTLWERGESVGAALYVGLSVAGALVALIIGVWCGRALL